MRSDWIATHAALQEVFHPESERAPGSEAWRRYVEYNWNAVIIEMAEVHRELEIRPWKEPTGIVIDKAKATMEIVDVLHFLGNIANAIGITDAEFDVAYDFKVAENRRRLASGRSVRTDVLSHVSHSPELADECSICTPKIDTGN